jgi:serine/threonine protein kinase
MAGLIGQNLGHYQILELLGEGGMATVYKAYDTHLEREVAIKIIRREAFPPDQLDMILKRFEREANALGRFSHPNIVNVIDYGEYEGSPYLVMVYLSGGTLKDRLGKPMPWREAVQLLIPIAQALEYVHDHNIINQDVKPSNILMTEKGQPMLTDFGLVKLFEDKEETTHLTASGAGLGTPDYMAPEQWTGETTALSDMYSLGVVLYEMITGHRPYTSDTPAGILLKQVSEPLPLPNEYIPNLPKNIEAVLLKVLARGPSNRYPDMHSFITELQDLLEGREVSALTTKAEQLREQMIGKVEKSRSTASPLGLQPARQKRMFPALIVALFVLALLVACGTCWFIYANLAQ